MEVVLAERLPVPLEEQAVAHRLAALGAGEVLGVPHLAQGDDHLAHDGLPALGAVAARDGLEVGRGGAVGGRGRRRVQARAVGPGRTSAASHR